MADKRNNNMTLTVLDPLLIVIVSISNVFHKDVFSLLHIIKLK